MEVIPEHRVVLGVDVIDSGKVPGYHRSAIPEAMYAMIDNALPRVGLSDRWDVVHREHQGDGALLTFPGSCVGRVLDAANELDYFARQHNRSRKPEIRLRLAVDSGPIEIVDGYYGPKINVSRLLSAAAFKDTLQHCLTKFSGMVDSGLLISDRVKSDVFGGDYTVAVREEEFEAIQVQHKEFSKLAWIRVPGVDTRSLAEFVHTSAQLSPTEPHPTEPHPTEPHPTEGRIHVRNQAGGKVSGVQAGVVQGGITFGPGGR